VVEAQRQKPCKGERRSGPQDKAKPAASLEVSAREGGGEGSAEPPKSGAWNVSIVATGTGEALPGPMICELSLGGVVIGSGDAL